MGPDFDKGWAEGVEDARAGRPSHGPASRGANELTEVPRRPGVGWGGAFSEHPAEYRDGYNLGYMAEWRRGWL